MPTPTSQKTNESLSDEQKSVIQPIRTYERDVAEALRSSGASVVSINLKQHEVAAPRPATPVDRVAILPQSPIQAQPKVAPVVVPLQKNPPTPPPVRRTLEQQIPKVERTQEKIFTPPPTPAQPQVPHVEVPPAQFNALRKPNEGKHYVYLEKEEVAKKSVFFLVSIVLLVAGLSAVSIIYFLKVNQEPLITTVERESIINTEYKERTYYTTLSKNGIITSVDQVKANDLPSSSIAEVMFINQSIPGNEENISVEQFMTTMSGTAPGNLVRALSDPWMLGVYAHGTKNESIMLMKVNSFENAFDGMLAWESTIASDLQGLFTKRTMSTSTAPTPTLKANFEDLVIKNKDARILKNSFGEIVLAYSFIDEQTLAIAWSREGLEEIIARYFVSRGTR